MKVLKRVWFFFALIFGWIKRHKYAFVTLVFFFIVLVVDDNNMIKYFANRNSISSLESEIAAMRSDSIRLMRQQALFGKDSDVEPIEKMGRQRGFQKDNEDVFIIELDQ